MPDMPLVSVIATGGTIASRAGTDGSSTPSLDGQALLDEYRGLIAQYTQELETQGYPWERG